MGKHYVPQQYLRGFESPAKPDWIWMYDKRLGTRRLVPIKKVAQEADFYTVEVEKSLTALVENPANTVIAKLQQEQSLTEEDRAHLAYYIGTMIRRVPRARANAYEMVAPKALADTVAELREAFKAAAELGRINAATLDARLAEIEETEKRFQLQPPPEIVELVETPWPTQAMLTAIYSMTWRFLRSSGPSFFLTSDNPASHFEAFGLGTEKAELSFPVSSTLFLHCSWQETRNHQILLPAPEKFCKEINRRIASGADRFIFYKEEQEWVLETAKNQIDQCRMIDWGGM